MGRRAKGAGKAAGARLHGPGSAVQAHLCGERWRATGEAFKWPPTCFSRKQSKAKRTVKRDGGLYLKEGKHEESFQKHKICIFRGKGRDRGEARGSLKCPA